MSLSITVVEIKIKRDTDHQVTIIFWSRSGLKRNTWTSFSSANDLEKKNSSRL